MVRHPPHSSGVPVDPVLQGGVAHGDHCAPDGLAAVQSPVDLNEVFFSCQHSAPDSFPRDGVTYIAVSPRRGVRA